MSKQKNGLTLFLNLPKEELHELVDSLEEEKLEEVISTLPVDKKSGLLGSLVGKNSGLTVVHGNSYSATGNFIQVNGSTDLSDVIRQAAKMIVDKASSQIAQNLADAIKTEMMPKEQNRTTED